MSSSSQPVALLSVHNKTHLEAFARALVERFNYRLLATGGTRKLLMAAGLPVEEVSAFTGAEELLEGRVKSLHPKVFAGILARRDKPEHLAQIETPIDLVCVNLYPFEAALNEGADKTDDEMIELIDIGGSALLRAAAKNHAGVTVLCDPRHYEAVLVEMVSHGGQVRPELRRRLAAEAFKRSVAYDTAISTYLQGDEGGDGALTDTLTINLQKVQPMRYGENPHQPAALYLKSPATQVPFELHHGKALSYNNLLDMEAAWALISEFEPAEQGPACAIIKHTQPCGVALGKDALTAYNRALDCDPMSAFGGIVAFNVPVDEDTAKALSALFLEVVVAPGFSDEALKTLEAKKNLRLVTHALPAGNLPMATAQDGLRIRQISNELFLAQTTAFASTEARLNDELKVVTQTQPTPEILKDLAFAWRVVKHLKSNAIVVAKNGQTLGLCGGQTSRVGALEQAVARACDGAQGAVLASDGFFPAVDNVEVAAQNRIAAIIQPGGSIKDDQVIAACERYHLAMLTTGVREFRH